MKRKWIFCALVGLLVFSMVACTTTIPTENADAMNTIVAQSVQLTQLAYTLTAIEQQPTQAQPTQAAADTPTPQQPTITPTKEGTWLTFTTNTNCRVGPGTNYYALKTFDAFDSVQVVARSEDSQYAYITYTDTSVHYCWVPAQFGNISGDLTTLRSITAIPTATSTITPTPAAGFSLSFKSVSSCSGNYYVRLLVKNTGYLTWRSIKIKVEDNTTDETVSDTSNNFTGYSGCDVIQDQDDLTTYEPGYVSNFTNTFDHDLDDDSLTITVTLYSKDNFEGTKISQSIDVTP